MCYNPKKIYLSRERLLSYNPLLKYKFENVYNMKKDARGEYIECPCRKCEECLNTIRQEWQKRIIIDVMCDDSQKFFLTLTYNTENVPVIPFGKKFEKYETKAKIYNIYTVSLKDICQELIIGNNDEYISHKLYSPGEQFQPEQSKNKRWRINPAKYRYPCFYGDFEPSPECFRLVHNKRDFDLFMKRFRMYMKRSGMDCTNLLRYVVVSEYGCAGERPHYHAIVYGFPKSYSKLMIRQCIQLAWNKGFVKLDDPKISAIRYVTKYMYSKAVVPKHCPNNFRFFSAGVGSSFDPGKLTLDDTGTMVFLPVGKQGAWKYVSIPHCCLAYYNKRVVRCPLYTHYRAKLYDSWLLEDSFGSHGVAETLLQLPKYCHTMLLATSLRALKDRNKDEFESVLSMLEREKEDARALEYNRRMLEYVLKDPDNNTALPLSRHEKYSHTLEELKHIYDKCGENLKKIVKNKMREVNFQYRQEKRKYSYSNFWSWYEIYVKNCIEKNLYFNRKIALNIRIIDSKLHMLFDCRRYQVLEPLTSCPF